MLPISHLPYLGEIASIAAAMTWAVTINIHTHYSTRFSIHAMNLYRISVGVIFLNAVIFIFKVPLPADGHAALLLLASGALGIGLGDLLIFAAMRRIGASLTSLIQISSPPFSALLSFLFLGEVLTIHEILGITLVTCSLGCLVWAKGRENIGQQLERNKQDCIVHGIAFAFCAAMSTAVSYAITRSALTSVHPLTGTALRMVGGFISMLILCLPIFGGTGVFPVKEILFNRHARNSLFIAAFLSTCLGFVFATIGLKYSFVGISAALQKTHPLFVMPIAYFFRGEEISASTVFLALLAIFGIALMFA